MKTVYYLSILAAFIYAGSTALPDTSPDSPRSIAIAIAGLVTILVAALAHQQEPVQNVPSTSSGKQP